MFFATDVDSYTFFFVVVVFSTDVQIVNTSFWLQVVYRWGSVEIYPRVANTFLWQKKMFVADMHESFRCQSQDVNQ